MFAVAEPRGSIWAVDVFEDTQFTDMRADAFDLQDMYFPPAWIPNNGRLELQDIRAAPLSPTGPI